MVKKFFKVELERFETDKKRFFENECFYRRKGGASAGLILSSFSYMI